MTYTLSMCTYNQGSEQNLLINNLLYMHKKTNRMPALSITTTHLQWTVSIKRRHASLCNIKGTLLQQDFEQNLNKINKTSSKNNYKAKSQCK